MKKFILPVLIGLLLLTSCSQALYKHKYDWVKMTPSPQGEARMDSVLQKAETAALQSAPSFVIESIEAFAAHSADSAVAPDNKRAEEIVAAQVHGEEPTTVDSTANRKTLQAAEQYHISPKDRKAFRRNANGGDIDWWTIGWVMAGLLVCLLTIAYWENPVIQITLSIWEILEIVFGLGLFVLLVSMAMRFCGQLFFMKDK